MKRVKTFAVLCVALITVNCASLDVSYFQDPEADFTRIKTYHWATVHYKPRGDELIIKNIKYAVNTQLEARGLQMTSENPDVLITPILKHRSAVDTQEYELELLTLDFTNAKNKELIWRGTAAGIINTSSSSEDVNNAIEEILANWPTDQSG